ncbi:MAG TPA: hypothetical protein VHY76_09770 [Acetobacteraceae bacterium]|nr:hypothetical protein [Acetobacteraceae bacterium]
MRRAFSPATARRRGDEIVQHLFSGGCVAPTLLVLALGACSPGPPRRQLDALIGQSPEQLVRTLGVPARSWQTGGLQFLAFDRRVSALIPGSGPVAQQPFQTPIPFSAGAGLGTPPEVVSRICETTFEIAGGRAVRWTKRGPGCG